VKPARYLVAKGLPTLPTKLVEKVWNLEFVEMEEFLPTPRALRIAEQGNPASSLQESLIGALSHFQALPHHKSQWQVMDLDTWVRCFMLYMAVISKRAAEMVPSMVAHLHTVLCLHQGGPQQLAQLEYDIQFQMEMAALADRAWTCGDPWQYISCLPSQGRPADPFHTSELGVPGFKGKGKRLGQDGHCEHIPHGASAPRG